MAYNQQLADRIHDALNALGARHVEKKMFGGVAFMVKGRMCCGVVKDDLMVRVPDDRYDRALTKAGVRKMDFTGRPMRGFLYVGGKGIAAERSLRSWLALGIEVVETVKSTPRKKVKRGKRS